MQPGFILESRQDACRDFPTTGAMCENDFPARVRCESRLPGCPVFSKKIQALFRLNGPRAELKFEIDCGITAR